MCLRFSPCLKITVVYVSGTKLKIADIHFSQRETDAFLKNQF